MDYLKDVLDDAVSFIQDHEEALKEAIVDGLDFDRNYISCLDEDFHCAITDRAYSLTDAAYIIESCVNEETDSGLWEGQQPEQAISTKAAFAYSMDVWFKCEEIYKEIKEAYEDALNDIEEEQGPGDEDAYAELAIGRSWRAFEHDYLEVEPVLPGSPEEGALLRRWLSLNESAGMWGGYPFGSAYIDTRCGSGHGMPEVKNFVDFDHEAAAKLPHLKGRYKANIRDYFEETFGKNGRYV